MAIKSKMTRKSLKTIEKITGGPLTLGKLIYSIRKCEELTQTEFAKILGLSKQHLCDIEHGRKTISPKFAALYSKKLGYSEEQFVRLCLQDIIKKQGLNFSIKLYPIQNYKYCYKTI